MLLKLRNKQPLSNFAFNFNLRRYTVRASVNEWRTSAKLEVGRCRLAPG